MKSSEAQSSSVKRAQVEFHNFASLGEPERAMRVYAEENQRRAAVIRKHLGIRFAVDNQRSIDELGIVYRPLAETLRDHYAAWQAAH